MARKSKSILFGRRYGESAEVDPNLWIVSYGDLMTNLMIFFLMLFALSSIKPKTVIEKEDEQKILVKNLEKYGAVTVSAEKINVTLQQDIIFKAGSAELKSGFTEVLAEVNKFINDNTGTIIVSGHADAVPLNRGKYKDNWYLSAERGWSVANELIKSGIDPKRFQIRGYGEFHPVAGNDTEEGRAKNRRIEMTIVRTNMKETERFIYYKTVDVENISEISKRFFGNETYSQQIRELNKEKIDTNGNIPKGTEILVPYNPARAN
ncbi:MAG: flagellar motor protein MotB [Elusimicrobia bacterium]|nr:flagellar motor protein MotB [Elusimicrobiota bacterium]